MSPIDYAHERGESKWKEYKGPAPRMPELCNRLTRQAAQYLSGRGLSLALAKFNGWYPSDMDVPRLVIPCMNSMGRVYYQARSMDSTTLYRYASPTAPRGDNVVTVAPFGACEKPSAVVVEGPMDALAAAAFGYLGIALMGNNPAPEALDLIVKSFAVTYEPFIIIPDKDDERFGATLVAAFATRGASSSMVTLPQGKDLCDLNLAARKRFFEKIKRSKK